jgi:hypothetical protein
MIPILTGAAALMLCTAIAWAVVRTRQGSAPNPVAQFPPGVEPEWLDPVWLGMAPMAESTVSEELNPMWLAVPAAGILASQVLPVDPEADAPPASVETFVNAGLMGARQKPPAGYRWVAVPL